LSTTPAIVAIDSIAKRIFPLRSGQVLLDSDLAALYDVPTKRFNEAVKRNAGKFPVDFMFQLSQEEWDSLRSQFATLKTGRGQHRKYLPHVFTEHGALMAAMILNSDRAIEVSVFVVRAFVELRTLFKDSRELARRIDELESKLATHDEAILHILATIRDMTRSPSGNKRPIGFV
jgi:hypothetical protein